MNDDTVTPPQLPTRQLNTLLGHQLTVVRDDHVGDKIAAQGLYEKDNLLFLLDLLAQMDSPTVLDIGANIGNHSLALSTRADRVLAFEPLPQVFRLLLDNIQQNQIDNIQPFNIALSDEAGMATIYMHREGNVGASGFEKRHKADNAIVVEKQTGDAVLASLGIEQVDFIKIDVEAHEAFVLKGLMETLTRCKPVITMEWNDHLTVERLADSEVMRFLESHYRILVLGSNYDKQYWVGQRFAFVRRKLTRLLHARSIQLYAFNRERLYKNILLIPKDREALLMDSV